VVTTGICGTGKKIRHLLHPNPEEIKKTRRDEKERIVGRGVEGLEALLNAKC